MSNELDTRTAEAMVDVCDLIVEAAEQEETLNQAINVIGASIETMLDAIANKYINKNVATVTDKSETLSKAVAYRLAIMKSDVIDELKTKTM